MDTKPFLIQIEEDINSETDSGQEDMDISATAGDHGYGPNKSVKSEKDPLKVEPGVNPESGEKPMVVNADDSDDDNQASDNSIIEVDQSPFNPRTIIGLEARVVLTDIRFTGELAAETTRKFVTKKKKVVCKKTKKLVENKVQRKPGLKAQTKIIPYKAPPVPVRDPNNPWDVRIVSDFLYYCCPECPVRSKKLSKFLKHANEKHDNFNKVCRSIHVRNPPVEVTRRKPKVPFEEWINTVNEEVEKNTTTLPNKRPRTYSEGEPFMAFEEVQVYCELDLGANHVIFPPNKEVVEIDASVDEDLICPPHVYLKPIGSLPQAPLDQPMFVPPQTPTVQTMVVPLLPTIPSMETPDESIMDTMPFLEDLLTQEPVTFVPDIPELLTEELEIENEVQRAEDGLYHCVGCNFKAKDLQPLRWHWKVHAKEDTFCRVCGWRFDNDGQQLLKHYQELHPFTKLPPEPLYKCTDCEVTCKGVNQMSKHMREEHKKRYKPYICPQCQKPTYHFKTNSVHFYTHKLPTEMLETLDPENEVQKAEDGLYHCDGCNFKGKFLALLRYHWKNHAQDDTFCRVCGLRFDNDGLQLVKHYQDLHPFTNLPNDPLFKCTDCEVTCKGVIAISKHMREEHKHPYKPYLCPHCQKPTDHFKMNSVHFYQHIDDGEIEPDPKTLPPRYEHVKSDMRPCEHLCPDCGKVFKHKAAFRIHHQMVHNNNRPTEFKCSQCDFVGQRVNQLWKHKRLVHETEKHVSCQYCKMSYHVLYLLNNHIEEKHQDEITNSDYICERCGIKFLQKRSMDRHNKDRLVNFGICEYRRAHCKSTGSKKSSWQTDPVTCDHCDSRLLNIKQFLKHFKSRHDGMVMRAHDRLVYPCFPCSKVFVTITGLEIHNCGVHKTGRGIRCPDCKLIYVSGQHDCQRKKGVKRFKCFYCDYRQTTRDGMKDHILFEHHGGDIPFKCGQCTQTFAFKDQLRSHIDNHHKKMTCELCDQTLASSWEYRKHQVFVHNIRHGIYFCNHCPKKFFVNKSRLETHMSEKHGEDSD